MTTIAYRDGVLASDSRATSDNIITSAATRKIVKAGRVLAAVCGTSAMGRDFLCWVERGCVGDMPSVVHERNPEWSFWAFLSTPEGNFLVQECGMVRVHGDYFAMGTGRELALGAMAHGATAEEAVAAAIKHDNGSGGPIRSVRRA